MAVSGSTDRTERRLHQQPFCQSTEIRNQLSYRTFLGILLASCFRSDHCFSVSEIRSGRWRNQSGFINESVLRMMCLSFCSLIFVSTILTHFAGGSAGREARRSSSAEASAISLEAGFTSMKKTVMSWSCAV